MSFCVAVGRTNRTIITDVAIGVLSKHVLERGDEPAEGFHGSSSGSA